MLAGFPQITGKIHDGRFSVESGRDTITVFTARSAERDLTQLRNLLQSAAAAASSPPSPPCPLFLPSYH